MLSFIRGMIGAQPRDEKPLLLARIEDLGITKDQFAKFIGVTPGCVNRWINGTHKLNPIANRVMMMIEKHPILALDILFMEIKDE